MRRIRLTQEKHALVDNEDFLRLNKFKWHFEGRYASRSILVDGKRKKVYLHRLVLDPPKGLDTDHINRDKLDNRRCNLRIANRSNNMINTPLRKDNKSGHKGICWDSNRQKWLASIKRFGRNIFFKRFLSREEAYKARQDFFKERGCLA